MEKIITNTDNISLNGGHSLHNALAVSLVSYIADIKNSNLRRSLKTFEGISHRLEKVRVCQSISFINDSKATNVNAVWYALESFHNPIVLIMGGRDKKGDFTLLREQIEKKVHGLVCYGEAANQIEAKLQEYVPSFCKVHCLEEATKWAYKKAKSGDIILLSPGCSSLDMYANYQERGNHYKKIISEL